MSAQTHVAVDPGRCRAYGLCVTIHPDVFSVPAGSSTVQLLREAVDAPDLEDVEEAARACPARAITLRTPETP
ncbi:ferredoxin [Streptomyces sp. NPDC001889]